MIKVSAPGKLFLSGEWSILEVGNPGIVTAVDKRVHVEIGEAENISITIDDFGIKDFGARIEDGKVKWEREISEQEEKDLMFMKGSIEAVYKYLGGLKPFRIRSWGEMSQVTLESGDTKKIGFGSSAASVVSTIAGLLKFNGVGIESMEERGRVYKLSAIAHYLVQGKVGSAFDVAASTYGGVFIYQRFDPKWLVDKVDSGISIKDVVEQEWPSFKAEPLNIPEGFELLIGWTKDSASTSAMVKQLNTWAETNQEEYKRLYDQIADLVRELIPEWKSGNKERILELLRRNEDYLRELGGKSGVNIETPELKRLSEIANQNGGAGKLSGAGGGDCGIAISFNPEVSERIKNEWDKAGFYLVNATMDKDGVRIED